MKLHFSLILLLLVSSGIVTSFSSWEGNTAATEISFDHLGKRAEYDSCDWIAYAATRRAVVHTSPTTSTVIPKPIIGRRLTIHGDFDGDGEEETLRECFRDSENRETYKFLATANYEAMADDLAKRATHSFMACDNAKIDTLEGGLQTFGFAHTQNLGNVDGQKGDEILVVFDWCDWSTLNQARVFSLRKNGWNEIASWLIRDTWLPYGYRDSESEQVYGFDYKDAKGYARRKPKDVDWCRPVETQQLVVTTLNNDFSELKDSIIVLP